MTKYLPLVLGIFLIFTQWGCDHRPNGAVMESAAVQAIAPGSESPPDQPVVRKRIKEGRLQFETDDLDKARETILDALGQYKGYVSSDQVYKSEGRISHTIIVRVPACDFDVFLEAVTNGVEKIDSKGIQVQDVTAEFVDIKARSRTKKALEDRYLALLKQTKSVSEILEVEKQLAELRSEIESIEGRLQYLQNQVSYSTLTISVYEQIPRQTAFGQKFNNGFVNGWNNLIWFFVVLTNIWPFVLLALGIILMLRTYRKRRKRRRTRSNAG